MSDLTGRLAAVEAEKEQLHRDLTDARTSLDNQRLIHEARRKSEDQLQSEVAVRDRREAELKTELSEIRSRSEALERQLEDLQADTEREIGRRLEEEREKWASVEAERDRMKAELEEVSTLIEDSTSALKFKLSSQNIELQQVKEVCQWVWSGGVKGGCGLKDGGVVGRNEKGGCGCGMKDGCGLKDGGVVGWNKKGVSVGVVRWHEGWVWFKEWVWLGGMKRACQWVWVGGIKWVCQWAWFRGRYGRC